MKWLKRAILAFVIIYILPVGGSVVWWCLKERPENFRVANWNASGMLPKPQKDEAAVYVMAARLGGLKGAVGVHSWLVYKKLGEINYQRYDVVGWGKALRHNAYAPDAYWYSNHPFIVKELHGAEAVDAIGLIEAAIARYPHGKAGDYTLYPGPNSNTFVATILRDVPQIGAVLPSNAIGRDFLEQGFVVDYNAKAYDLRVNYNGYIGLALGRQSGVEVNIGGLVAGVDFWPLAVKIPAIGRVGF